MLYAILAYHEEHVVQAMSEAEDGALMDRLFAVHESLGERLGPAVRLGATELAVSVRGRGLVTDGPFAETKEALLGFYIVDCASSEAAAAVALDLKAANPGANYEVRPVVLYTPGQPFPVTDAGLEIVRPARS